MVLDMCVGTTRELGVSRVWQVVLRFLVVPSGLEEVKKTCNNTTITLIFVSRHTKLRGLDF